MANGKRVKDFRPASRNANKHTARGMGELQKSIQSDGWIGAMTTAADGEMIAGSARIETVAQVFGTDAEPIIVETDGTRPVVVVRKDIPSADDKRAQRLALADNRVHEIDMSWDVEVLAGFDADVLGELWTPEELSDLGQQWADDQRGKQEDAGAQVDKAEELRVKWGAESGQLWQLGEHRLICGDCTDAATVASLGKVDALFTDPPYGIDYDPRFLPEIAARHNKRLSSTNKLDNDDGSLDLSFLWQYDKRMVWGFPYIYDSQATGWIVWDKQPGVESRGIVTPIEMASTTMRKGFDMVRVMWGGFYRAAGEDRQPHPTQKPVGVVAPFIEAWTKADEVIFDPFLGSGTTLIACERLGRKCRAIEISSSYCAVAIERWAQTTGKTPILANGA